MMTKRDQAERPDKRGWEARPSGALQGDAVVPGDKSLSHRALFLSALAAGRSKIRGLGAGADILSSAGIIESLGVSIRRGADLWEIDGLGLGGLAAPQKILACGNSGTTARLLMGILAGHPFTAFLEGDESLSKRPMGRFATPLGEAGAVIKATAEGDKRRLPLSITGTRDLLPFDMTPTLGSAQLKSALLFAALHANGESSLVEALASRDHTERMMPLFGIHPKISKNKSAQEIRLTGGEEVQPAELVIARDPSSAAFLAAAAALLPKSEIHLPHICVNPLRMGFFRHLESMGAKIDYADRELVDGEERASLTIKSPAQIRMKGGEVAADAVPSMIDEFPILAIVAAHGAGRSHFRGLSELRIKESDRLQSVLLGLKANGVDASLEGDDLIIEGCGGPPAGGGVVKSFSDHRIAMAFLILGLTAKKPIFVEGADVVGVSFPNFLEVMRTLGADLG